MEKTLMDLETEELLPPIGFTGDVKKEDKIIQVKFECPSAVWYGVEYDDENQVFYGYVDNYVMPEYSTWGYFDLADLQELKDNPPLRAFFVRRDESFKPTKASTIDGINFEIGV